MIIVVTGAMAMLSNAASAYALALDPFAAANTLDRSRVPPGGKAV